jgi:hypothetical protein
MVTPPSGEPPLDEPSVPPVLVEEPETEVPPAVVLDVAPDVPLPVPTLVEAPEIDAPPLDEPFPVASPPLLEPASEGAPPEVDPLEPMGDVPEPVVVLWGVDPEEPPPVEPQAARSPAAR